MIARTTSSTSQARESIVAARFDALHARFEASTWPTTTPRRCWGSSPAWARCRAVASSTSDAARGGSPAS